MHVMFLRITCVSLARALQKRDVWCWAVVLGLMCERPWLGAQDLRYMNRQTWSTEEGLPQPSVHEIVQASDGYLWLATEGGAARFDGLNFSTLTHENSPAFGSDDVSSIAQDRSGALWFGTAEGLIRKDGRGIQRLAEADGLPSAVILALAPVGDGSMLVLTSAGLARCDGHGFLRIDEAGSVLGLEQQADGSVLLFRSAQVDRYQNGKVEPNVFPVFNGDAIRGVQQSAKGDVWAWSNREVTMLAQGRRTSWRAGVELQGSRVQTLLVDQKGIAWIGTNRGLLTVDPGVVNEARPVDGFNGESILSIEEDREGNHWIGTEGDGLHALRRRKFAADPASAFEAVTAVVRGSDGGIWYGTRDGGVRRIVGGKAETPVQPGALTSPVILSLAAGMHGDMWVGTPDGLNHVDGGVVRRWTSAEGMPDDFVRSLALDADGGVWAGTRRGLVDVAANGKLKVFTTEQGLASDSVGDLIRAPDGSSTSGLWIGTAAGLSYLDRGEIRSLRGDTAVSRSAVTALCADGERHLWIGLHDAGLNLLEGGEIQQVSAPGVPREIESMQADTTGHLWLRARSGVYRARIDQLKRCVTSSTKCAAQIQQFGTADGLPSDELAAAAQPSMAFGADGTLWLATRKGLGLADPERMPFDAVPPPTVIQQFLVDGMRVPDQHAIRYGQHRYSIDYAGLSYTMPSRTRYRYQLQGYDRDWVDGGTRRSAYYTGLAPGSYRFLVLAENADGVWSARPAEVTFRIVPPLYRRWWAYCLDVVAAGLILLLIVRLRLRAEQRRFSIVLNERNRVAREIHDTLAQDLVSVALHLEIASSMVKTRKLDEAADQLRQTRTLVKQGLESARQSIWSLRANTAQNSLPTRLSASVERFRGKLPNTHLKIGGAYRELQHDLEDQVMRIADESLENVRRHAAANAVWVELVYEGERLILHVKDDGKGFRPSEAQSLSGHYGLRGMEERAATLGARITITSDPGEGTSVMLVVPLSSVKS